MTEPLQDLNDNFNDKVSDDSENKRTESMDQTFLHCIDLSDQLKNANFCSRRVIESLFSLQLLLNDPKPNPRNMDIERLRNCTSEDINGVSSPRMGIIYQGSLNRNLIRPLDEEEKNVIRKADLEIAFEKVRRTINYSAPSRLSCLYIAEDSFDGRLVLQDMFVTAFSRPMLIEVRPLNIMGEIFKGDHRWIDQYYENPDPALIESYWQGLPYSENSNSWEFLMEGTLIMTNREQMDEIDAHVRIEMPAIYQQIIEERNNNRAS